VLEDALYLVKRDPMCQSMSSDVQRALEAAGDTGGIYHMPIDHLCNMATALLGEADVLSILVGCEQMPLDSGRACQFPGDSRVCPHALPPFKVLACRHQAGSMSPDMTQATPEAGSCQ
jgi:hypothetical protein